MPSSGNGKKKGEDKAKAKAVFAYANKEEQLAKIKVTARAQRSARIYPPLSTHPTRGRTAHTDPRTHPPPPTHTVTAGALRGRGGVGQGGEAAESGEEAAGQ